MKHFLKIFINLINVFNDIIELSSSINTNFYFHTQLSRYTLIVVRIGKPQAIASITTLGEQSSSEGNIEFCTFVAAQFYFSIIFPK